MGLNVAKSFIAHKINKMCPQTSYVQTITLTANVLMVTNTNTNAYQPDWEHVLMKEKKHIMGFQEQHLISNQVLIQYQVVIGKM